MSQFFTKEIYTKVEEQLNKPNVDKAFSQIVEKYIDYNSAKLSTSGPVNKTLFSDAEKKKIFDLLQIDEKFIVKTLSSSSSVKSTWKIMTKPFNILMACIIRFYSLKKDYKMVNKAVAYYMFSIYPSYFKKYFTYGTNENIMNYTINNMSNKYKIKQEGVLLISLISTAYGSYTNYQGALDRGEDKAYVDLIMGINTRINSFLKKIATEYYDNHKKQNFLNVERDNFDDENYSESKSNVFVINTITNGVVSNMINYGVNYKYVDIAAKMNKISRNELKNHVNLIISNHNEDLPQIIEGILYTYLISGKKEPKQINSSDFILFCMDVYKKSNTVDNNIIKVKKILDGWMSETELYRKTQRVATINNFRRAVFTFFVLTIQSYRV
ncbi:MAG: hypothetical protein PHF63_00255 [Herbinix sp.]|nr:hypothetical protein [Herbinix sp.]